MIYMRNITITTAKSATYLENVGLGTFVVSYIRGPLASSVRIQRHNEAETRLSMGMQLAAVASATRQANNGDCDGDGYIEPIGSVAKIVKLEHAWRRLNGWSDDGFQVAPFPG